MKAELNVRDLIQSRRLYALNFTLLRFGVIELRRKAEDKTAFSQFRGARFVNNGLQSIAIPGGFAAIARA